MTGRRYLVTILQHRLLHYRVDLFQRLRERLAERNVELRLVHGQASSGESVRKDEGELTWAEKVKNIYWTVGGKDLCWQPLPKGLKSSDLIIIMQENRILSNYPLLLSHIVAGTRLAYWGHGANLQSVSPRGLRELWKRILLTRVDWWFAYTSLTVDIVTRCGFPPGRVTCLNNAIDTSEFRRLVVEAENHLLDEIISALGLKKDSKIGLFCGSLYKEKKLEFLVASGDMIFQRIPEFRLIVIGDGPGAAYLNEQFESRPWATCVGVKRGQEKAAFFRLGHVVLNPGAVGLHVLDAFGAGLPMVTTRNALHGPEVVYLQNGKNGYLTEDNAKSYGDAVVDLLVDERLYNRISTAAKESAKEYTLDNMVKNFVDGIVKYLSNEI